MRRALAAEQQREDNSETAQDMRRGFEACGKKYGAQLQARPQAKESATCDSSFTQKILVMKPESFSAILKERLLHPVLVEPADERDVRLQLNNREKTEKRRREVERTIRKPSGGRTTRKRSGLREDNKETKQPSRGQ